MQRVEQVTVILLIAVATVHARAEPRSAHPRAPSHAAAVLQTQVIDVNRPRTPFDCELPLGEQWYGSRGRCLSYLCGGQNVYNEYIFDADNRRHRNPCYGQNPTEFPE